MASEKLSKTVVERLHPSDGDTIYWDTELPGFGVRVKRTGVKSFVVQYRSRANGTSKRLTLGKFGPLLSFSRAKDLARGILVDAARGGDLVSERQAVRVAPSMADMSSAYMERHAIPKKRPRSAASDQVMINRFILPKLSDCKVRDVGHQDVQALHNAMQATPYLANRLLSLLSKMLELSIRWGWRSDNPARGVEKFPEQKRDRWLSEDELDRLTSALDGHSNRTAATAIRLQLLTGARIGEVLTSRWSDFDLKRGVWTKPSHHTKQKRTEHLPLSGAAVALLAEWNRHVAGPFVFPGRSGDRPLTSLKTFWGQVCKTAEIPNYRVHDNRHTHASHLVSSGLSLPIVGRLLGHTNPSTTQRYAHLADGPLRAAAEVMAQKLGESKSK